MSSGQLWLSSGPPEKARRTGSCRKCFRQTFVYHLLETQVEERIKNLWKQHPDTLWKVNESLERIEVMFPAACVACRYRSPACLPLKLCWFLSLALRGALSAPLCVVVVVYIFYYVLPSFHAGPWITAHFEKIDTECQTPQAPEKNAFIWAPVSQVWRWLWPMWVWRVSDRVCHGSHSKHARCSTCRACRWRPVRGCCVLMNFSGDWSDAQGVEEQQNLYFITENGRSVPTPCFLTRASHCHSRPGAFSFTLVPMTLIQWSTGVPR